MDVSGLAAQLDIVRVGPGTAPSCAGVKEAAHPAVSPCEARRRGQASSFIGSITRASLKFGLLMAVDTGHASKLSDGTPATLSIADS